MTRITDEARKAASLAIHCRLSVGSPSSWIGGVNPPSTDDLADAALLAALPHLEGAAPLLDRDAVRKAALRDLPNDVYGATVASLITNSVMKLARPMPTDAQIAEAVTEAWASPDASLGTITAAVLALIGGAS